MIIVFAGPTISHQEINQYLDCVCLPPVSHSDLFEIIAQKPDAIGIIDGYFEGAPSVWHKEILYAMDQGIHVFGSASMGALRAAELSAFGMQGIGQIFDWYVSGEIEDDDEVAVLHGPAEAGFVVASEPMVSIRATLNMALESNILSMAQYQGLIDCAKNMFYKKRGWRELLEQSKSLFQSQTEIDEFRKWVALNRIDLKKSDALAMLDAMKQNAGEIKKPYQTKYYFEWTNVWDAAYSRYQASSVSQSALTDSDQLVMNQLYLNPEHYGRINDQALFNWVIENKLQADVEEEDIQTVFKQFRRSNHFGSRDILLQGMQDLDLDESALKIILKKAAVMNQFRKMAGSLQTEIIELLKINGDYLSLLNQANRKREVLGSLESGPQQTKILPIKFLRWYFEDRLKISMPDSVEQYIKQFSLENCEQFHRIVEEEYIYWQQQS